MFDNFKKDWRAATTRDRKLYIYELLCMFALGSAGICLAVIFAQKVQFTDKAFLLLPVIVAVLFVMYRVRFRKPVD